ncbi:MAG: cytochrome c3 family protein [Bacteroidota bacterium]
MGRSLDVASKAKSAARFFDHAVVFDTVRNLWYYPHWSGSDLFFDEMRLNGRDTVFLRSEQIDYIVGSGQHTNSHLTAFNGYLYQAPLTYYTQEGRWDLPPGFEGGHNSRFNREIELECMSCHNAYPALIVGSENKYSVVPSGIDCERCHGPGSRHVALKSKGELIDTSSQIDYSIVNPAKLPIDLQLDICQRCHIQGNSVLQPGKTFLDFRPGAQLKEIMDVYMPVYKGREDEHIMASHAERMKLSRCFLESRKKAEANGSDKKLRPYEGAMTCVTCHDPHVSVKETGPETYNNACRKCHAGSNGGTVCSDAKSIRMKGGGNCSGCHMPKNNTIDIPHVVTTDHRIGRPVSKQKVASIREFVTLSCINNPDPSDLSRAVAFLNQFEKFVSNPAYLDSASRYLNQGDEKRFLICYNALIRCAYLKKDYTEVMRLAKKRSAMAAEVKKHDGEDAWTFYRIGDSYVKSGELESGIQWLKVAVKVLPYQLDFRSRLAACLHGAGKVSEAEQEFLFVLSEQPKQPSVLVNYGYLLLTERNDLKRADSLYRMAIRLDPDHVQALVNLAGTSVMSGDITYAKGLIDRALRIDPKNRQAVTMKTALAKGVR